MVRIVNGEIIREDDKNSKSGEKASSTRMNHLIMSPVKLVSNVFWAIVAFLSLFLRTAGKPRYCSAYDWCKRIPIFFSASFAGRNIRREVRRVNRGSSSSTEFGGTIACDIHVLKQCVFTHQFIALILEKLLKTNVILCLFVFFQEEWVLLAWEAPEDKWGLSEYLYLWCLRNFPLWFVWRNH
jgi:hypothetical protein